MAETMKEFLTFKLGKEEFAVDINRVQEIRGWQEPSPLPNVPKFVKGVIDLRGTVVPIIDLRDRFKLNATYNATTVVIVVHLLTQLGEKVVGLVVDAVSDVHMFDMNSLQPPPDISSSIDSQFMMGLTTKFDSKGQGAGNSSVHQQGERKVEKGMMVIIIDIDRLASEGLIEQISSTEEPVPLRNG